VLVLKEKTKSPTKGVFICGENLHLSLVFFSLLSFQPRFEMIFAGLKLIIFGFRSFWHLSLGLHVLDEINDPVGVSVFVVVPGDELDKVLVQLDSGLGVEDGGPLVGDEVGGHDHVLGVAQVALHGALGHLLHLLADLLVAGLLLEAHGQIDHGHVGGGHAEGHSGDLAVEGRDDLADSLGGASGGGNDVLSGATAVPPVLVGGSVHGLLGGGDGVHGGHETLDDAEVVVDDLGDGSEAVGGAGRVGDDVHGVLVLLVVDAHNEHGCVSRGSGDDDLLGASGEMGSGLLHGGEDTGGLDDVVCAGSSPGDGSGVTLVEDGDLLSVDDSLSPSTPTSPLNFPWVESYLNI